MLAILGLHRDAVAEDGISLKPLESWSNFFADSDVELRYDAANLTAHSRLFWSFISAERRVLSRGEVDLAAQAGEPTRATIRLHTPTVNPGVVLQTALLVAAVSRDAPGKPQAAQQRLLSIFPPNPFADRVEHLKRAPLRIFDPRANTSKALTALQVPLEEVYNPAALVDLSPGLLLVGEGISFAEERGLADVLVAAAVKGQTVVCLAPTGGTIPLPLDSDGSTASASSVTLRKQEVISQFDKRLDALSWPVDGRVVASGVAIKTEGLALVGEVAAGDKNWPWLDVGFPGGGRLVICGFGILAHWNETPAPRYLLASVLESIVNDRNPSANDPRKTEP